MVAGQRQRAAAGLASAEADSPSRGVVGLHVAELAKRTGVPSATIRYYSRSGLLSPQREPDNGYRRFSSADEHRLIFIRQAQALGLTLADIQVVFADVEQGTLPCEHVLERVETRLEDIGREIAALQEKQAHMRAALDQWRQLHFETPHPEEFCPLIERLE